MADGSLPADAPAESVLFVGVDGTTKIGDEDADNFSWDDTNNRLGLGTNAPLDVLQAEGDGKRLFMATGSTAARQAPENHSFCASVDAFLTERINRDACLNLMDCLKLRSKDQSSAGVRGVSPLEECSNHVDRGSQGCRSMLTHRFQ